MSSRSLRGLGAVLGCLALASYCLARSVRAAARAHVPAPAPCSGADTLPIPSNVTAIDTATLCLINRMRAVHGLRMLQPNAELARVARAQVSVMVRWDYFADVRPTGQTPMALVAATRYPARASFSVGQNIAWGTGPNATPTHTVAAWMQSPPHRAILLNGDFRDAGVAVTPSVPAAIGRGRGGATYAIVFGVRRH